jgi:hypothetical protein
MSSRNHPSTCSAIITAADVSITLERTHAQFIPLAVVTTRLPRSPVSVVTLCCFLLVLITHPVCDQCTATLERTGLQWLQRQVTILVNSGRYTKAPDHWRASRNWISIGIPFGRGEGRNCNRSGGYSLIYGNYLEREGPVFTQPRQTDLVAMPGSFNVDLNLGEVPQPTQPGHILCAHLSLLRECSTLRSAGFQLRNHSEYIYVRGGGGFGRALQLRSYVQGTPPSKRPPERTRKGTLVPLYTHRPKNSAKTV